MAPPPLACVFDAYGTLFDVGSAAARCRAELGDKTEPLVRLWREKQLQYTWLRTMQGRHADLWQVTGDALAFALEALEVDASPTLRDRLMTSYLTLDPYPDAADCLTRLKAAGLATAILSNGTPAMLEPMVGEGGLAGLLDHVLSVETVGAFKTAPQVYQLALDTLGVSAERIVFVSSNGWDAYAASAFGMRVAWCNRAGQPRERLPGCPDWVLKTLVDLPGQVLGRVD